MARAGGAGGTGRDGDDALLLAAETVTRRVTDPGLGAGERVFKERPKSRELLRRNTPNYILPPSFSANADGPGTPPPSS